MSQQNCEDGDIFKQMKKMVQINVLFIFIPFLAHCLQIVLSP